MLKFWLFDNWKDFFEVIFWRESSAYSLEAELDNSFQSFQKHKSKENLEDNRNSDRSEKELRCVISIFVEAEQMGWKFIHSEWTQAMIRQTTSALASSVSVDSGISSSLASSTPPLTNLTISSRLSESPGASDLVSYPSSGNKKHRHRQSIHSYRLKSTI